jgi:hypothetical protein
METKSRQYAAVRLTLIISLGLLAGLGAAQVRAECNEVVSGLLGPMGITQSNKGNLLVAESGPATPNSARISIVSPQGERRTLVSGLPSGVYFETGQASGPSGLFLHGRTLYVTIGIGDSIMAGPGPGLYLPNPNPSSPLFSSVLAIHFSANVEKTTTGFTLTLAQQQTLASGQNVTLSNAQGDRITIELVVNFPNYTPDPRASFPRNVRGSNPFDLVALNNHLYVTDAAQNTVNRVELDHGTFSVLATFPPIPNPLFPNVGGPFIEAVPTGIAYADGKLLVALFRGFPFLLGTSVVEKVDPQTANHAPLITGLSDAIDVLAITKDSTSDDSKPSYLILQFASAPFLSPPGLLLEFDSATSSPRQLADCLVAPTSMTLDSKTEKLYVTALTGQIIAIRVNAEAH